MFKGQIWGDFHGRKSSHRVFHGFRGHLQQGSVLSIAGRRLPQPQTSAKGKVAITLALLVLGATTAAVALTASHRANVAGPNWQQSATFINLPGVVGFEDALY